MCIRDRLENGHRNGPHDAFSKKKLMEARLCVPASRMALRVHSLVEEVPCNTTKEEPVAQ